MQGRVTPRRLDLRAAPDTDDALAESRQAPRRARAGLLLYLAAWGLAGVVLSGGLILISLMVDHCSEDARFCLPAAVPEAEAPRVSPHPDTRPEARPPGAPAGDEPARGADRPDDLQAGHRPVFAHAFDPLPLGMDGEAGRVYVLPPGRDMLEMATLQGAISTDEITLIAVVQQDGTRHALVRLPDGRILRLVQGDRLEDGTVAAISDDALYLMGPDQVPRAFVLGG